MMLSARKTAGRIGPGPSGLVFVVVTTLILAAAVYTQANLLFWALGLLIGGLVVSVLWSVMALRGIQVRRLDPEHAVAGEATVLRYQITNRSRLAVFSLTVHETWGRGPGGWRRTGPIAADPPLLNGRPWGWVLHLGPGQTTLAEVPCYPRSRGALAFGHIVVGSSFPFSIVRKAVHFNQPARMRVYPHLYRMNGRVISALARADAGGHKHVDRRGGQEEFFGLREYRSGDSLKLIDWKRSAATNRLVAREMTRPAPPRVMLRLDLTPNEGAAAPDRVVMEQAISLAASVICDAYLHGYPVGMTVAGYDCPPFPPHHSLPHRTRMLEALTDMDLTQPGASAPTTAGGRPSVVIWTGDDDDKSEAGGGGAGNPRSATAGRPTVLGAGAIHQYVVEASPRSLLHDRVRSSSRQ